MKIPFCKTDLGEEEIQAIADCIRGGWVVLGPKSQEFEEEFAEYVGANYAVFVDSGTSALFLALKYKTNTLSPLRIAVPSFTFTSTAEVIVNTGNIPVFVDVDLKTFCLDDYRIFNIDGFETFTPMALPVHLTGNKAKLKADIYDSAHRIEKDDVKESDALWCYSFYATKNLTTVQGGMIATNDKNAYEWLKMARDHGLDMGTKERYTGKYKQYDVKFVGCRVKGDDLRAVIGLEQLKKLPQMTEKRNAIVKKYNESFGLNRIGNHVYPILVNERDKFMQKMIEAEIQCTVHFKPLHLMTGYKEYHDGSCLINTEYLGNHIVSIPMFPQLKVEEQEYIISEILKTKQLI